MNRKQLTSIQTWATGTFLRKMGYNRNFPRAVAFAPESMGGLDLRHLPTEQGLSQIRFLFEHVYNDTLTGKMMLISLESLQLEAGTASLLLTDPTPYLPYITPCWITSLRDFLRINQISIQFETPWNCRLSRRHDRFIMDVLRIDGNFSDQELINLNATRLFLQVATLSDIATADGLSLTPEAYFANPIFQRTSQHTWPRQLSVTAKQRNLWTTALERHLLRTASVPAIKRKTLQLRNPLGEWTTPPNQTWTFYYDQRSEALIHYSDEAIPRSHSRIASRSRQLKKFEVTSSIPSHDLSRDNLTPADVVATPEYLDAKYHQHSMITSGDPQIPITTQEEYLVSLPPVRRRLLAQIQGSESRIVPFQHTRLLLSNDRWECGSDGGLYEGMGTMGYALTVKGTVIWKGSGPVDGDPTTSSLRRSELFGFAALLELLLMIKHVNPSLHQRPKDSIEVTVWIDSASAIKQISNIIAGHKPRPAWPNDADILAHIRWLVKQSALYRITPRWVKAHQNTETPLEQLPLNAKINTLVDELATCYRSTVIATSLRPRSNPLFFPASRISLIINGQRTTAQYNASIRYHINGTRLRQFLQLTRGWADNTWNTIDFQGMGYAYKKQSPTGKRHATKLLYGWNNTGSQRIKIHPQADARCPRCQETPETQDHVFQCQDRRANVTRYNALVALRSHIATKVGGTTTWTAFTTCLAKWMENKPLDDEPSSVTSLKTHFREVLLLAIKEQTIIGWKYAARGLLSRNWTQAYAMEKRCSKTAAQQQWLSQVITGLWSVHQKMWTNRNDTLHSTNPVSQIIKASTIDSQIQQMYELQSTFAQPDQRLFQLPLEQRLKSNTRSKRYWLVLAARYRATTSQRLAGSQYKMTHFFPKLRPPDRPPPQPPDTQQPITTRSSNYQLRKTRLTRPSG
jgi:hypothetical protein